MPACIACRSPEVPGGRHASLSLLCAVRDSPCKLRARAHVYSRWPLRRRTRLDAHRYPFARGHNTSNVITRVVARASNQHPLQYVCPVTLAFAWTARCPLSTCTCLLSQALRVAFGESGVHALCRCLSDVHEALTRSCYSATNLLTCNTSCAHAMR